MTALGVAVSTASPSVGSTVGIQLAAPVEFCAFNHAGQTIRGQHHCHK